ncbi:MAG: hypothetical protein KGO05_13830 [Chloroflexota bacterium]|nr:hypothetical protein [Chloroflexota bacterium]
MTLEQGDAALARLRVGAGREVLAFAGDTATAEARERLRADVVAALAFDLHPTDRPLTLWLLAQEVAAHEARGAGASEALYTLVAAVARFGQPEDAPLLWRAREATEETRAGVDVEQFARLGIAEARAALAHEDDGRALAWLDGAAAVGAFDDLPGYFLWADERFGLRVSGPT